MPDDLTSNTARNDAGHSGPTMPTEAEKASPAKQSSDRTEWYNSKWLPYLCCAVLIYQNMNRQNRPPAQPIAPVNNQQFAIQKQQRQNATLAYWHAAVASLHEIRFQMPTGDEPASQFYDRMYLELGKLTSRAESAPTTSVDQDLLDLARRHLAVEHRLLLANVKTSQLLKEAGVPAGSDTISDRIAHGEGLVTAALANPTLLDKIPEGELKALFMELLDLEKQRLEQRREIEIMQAVLQERYSGTKFQLPNVN